MGLSTGQKWAIGVSLFGLASLVAYLTRSRWLPVAKKLGGPLATCDHKFLFVGDSLTAYTQSYADQLKSICPQLRYTKVAKSGEKTDWMLTQLHNTLQTEKPDVIIIWGGVNDIYARNSIALAKQNLTAMYDLAKSAGAKVVAVTIIPTRTYKNATDKTVSLSNELNTWIKGNGAIDAVVDANKALNNGNDGTKTEFLQADTLHLTPSGQASVMFKLREAVF